MWSDGVGEDGRVGRRGLLFILSSPSGAGKSTLTGLLRNQGQIRLSVSVTTREKRHSEVDGIHYRFIDQDEFHALLEKLDGDVSRAECLLDFEVADTEGDGYIGFKEFVVWWTN